MARQLRVEYEGAIYHITCRMIGDHRLEQSRLFTDDRDRERFIESLAERVEQYNIRLYQFVCMTNHFHLVFETPEGNCSKFMQSLTTAYTVYYNLRHGRHGHLMDGRYKSKLVEGDEYLLSLTRYVHLNPVKVAGVKDKAVEERIRYLREYPWSTYRSYIGKSKPYEFVEYGPILGMMQGGKGEWRKRYRGFVESGLAEDDEEFKMLMKKSPRSIGGEGFRSWVDKMYQDLMEGDRSIEDVAFRRITEPLKPEVVLEIVAGAFGVEVGEFYRRSRSNYLRAAAACYLIRYAGLSQRDAAKVLNAGSGSAISKQLRGLSENMHKDKSLTKTMIKIEKELEDKRAAGKQ